MASLSKFKNAHSCRRPAARGPQPCTPRGRPAQPRPHSWECAVRAVFSGVTGRCVLWSDWCGREGSCPELRGAGPPAATSLCARGQAPSPLWASGLLACEVGEQRHLSACPSSGLPGQNPHEPESWACGLDSPVKSHLWARPCGLGSKCLGEEGFPRQLHFPAL